MQFRTLPSRLRTAYREGMVPSRLRAFESWLERSDQEGLSDGYDHAETVREYYTLCNEFMVSSWGESLHFAPLSPDEELAESQIRHQRRIISSLELKPGLSVIDVGCGIGGPMRRVVSEAGVRVLGVNINEHQLSRAQALNAEAGIGDQADFLAASFMDMSAVADETFDRGYAIESTCHAPDKVGAFTEIHRVLKPGALFWGQEMCMTELFDPSDDGHQQIKRELMRGIALKEIATMPEVNRALEAAGFEVIEAENLGVGPHSDVTPWYRPIEQWVGATGGLRGALLDRRVVIGATRAAEQLRIFPKGSAEVVQMMDRTASAYIAGGRTGIYTPLYCFLARKR